MLKSGKKQAPARFFCTQRTSLENVQNLKSFLNVEKRRNCGVEKKKMWNNL